MLNRREFIAGIAVAATAGEPARLRAACQTNAWKMDDPPYPTLLQALAAIKKLGFDGFETGYRNVEATFADPKAAKAEIQQTGLRFFACHIFRSQYEAKTNLPEFELIDRVARGAAGLGAERLIVSGSPVEGDAQMLSWKAGGLNRAGRLTNEVGLGRVCYHNHGPEFENNAAEMEALMKETDSDVVRFVIDCGHALRRKADIAGFFAKHHKRIEGLHLRDFKNDVQVPLGQGEFSYAPLAAAIRKAKWTGWVINEEERESGEKPGESAVGPAREQVKKLFGV